MLQLSLYYNLVFILITEYQANYLQVFIMDFTFTNMKFLK